MYVSIITNLYPDHTAPYFGTFVKDSLPIFGSNVRIVYPGNKLRQKKASFYIRLYILSVKSIWNADKVIFHYPLFFLPLIILARLLGKQPVIIYHGGEFMWRPNERQLLSTIKRIIFRLNNVLARKILVPTKYVEEKYFAKHYKKTLVWYSGGITVPTSYEEKVRCLDFAFFGRREYVKGYDCFVNALDKLKVKQDVKAPKITCLIVCREERARRIECEGNIACVYSPPLTPIKVYQAMQRSKFVVIPSRNESLCLLALEAAVRGAVVIARRLPAILETLGDAALYFDDDEELSGIMDYAISLPDGAREVMRDNLRRHAARFDKRRIHELFQD